MQARPKHVTIIGVGLLGGSIGLAIKAWAPSTRVVGVGRSQGSLDRALSAGAIDQASLDAPEAVSASDLVILATPVGAFERHLRAIAPRLKKSALVTDVGSTKADVVKIAHRLLGRAGPFVGSHPMAGSDQRGVDHAQAQMLRGATCIVTPTPQTPAPNLRRIQGFWEALGMKTLCMTPGAHDKAVARISHLPHALSGLLMLLARQGDWSVAARGFRDMTRLAGGDPEMWRDIFLTNRPAVLAGLDHLARQLQAFRALVAAGQGEAIFRHLQKAQKARRRFLDAQG